jgi:hypothetical protein
VNASASSLARKAGSAGLSGCEESLFGNVCWFGMTQDCTSLEGHPEIGAAKSVFDGLDERNYLAKPHWILKSTFHHESAAHPGCGGGRERFG